MSLLLCVSTIVHTCWFGFFFFFLPFFRGRNKKAKDAGEAAATSSSSSTSSPPSKKKSGRSDSDDAAASTSNGHRANPFLNAGESSMFRHLPNLKIKPLVSGTPTAQLKGPTESLLSVSHGDLASACSVSTYPHIPVRLQ
jgi:hypothetical protein